MQTKIQKIEYCLVNEKMEPKIAFSHSDTMFKYIKEQNERHGTQMRLKPARMTHEITIEIVTEN